MNRFEALKHAVVAHAGAVDKCGQPYILHPIAVASALEPLAAVQALADPDYEDAVVVALLHDVWEDSDYELPFPAADDDRWEVQIVALGKLSRADEETYAEYIERICGSRVACLVKLADLWHNTRPERLGCLPANERKGLGKRYLKARDRLWSALGYEWWPGEGKG